MIAVTAMDARAALTGERKKQIRYRLATKKWRCLTCDGGLARLGGEYIVIGEVGVSEGLPITCEARRGEDGRWSDE
jgi:hypothetical protein